jgi:phosphate transport system substrate-binding protein
VLYEMLAGRPPFGAESDTEFTIKSLHVKEMPAPLRRWNPNVPEEFEWIVLRALNKDPERRFAGCAEMAASLGAGLPEIADVSRRRPVQSELSSGSARQASASAVASPPAMAPLLSSVVPVAQPARPAVIPIAVKQPPARPTRSRLGLWIALAVVFLLAGATLALLRDRIFAAPEQIVLSLKGSTSVGDELAPRMAEAFLRDEMKATQVGSYIAKKDAAGHSFVHVWGRVPGDSDRQVIEIYATGSGDAFKCLAAGSGADHCDIGMASRPYNDQDRQKYPSLGNLGSGATEHVVALDGIAVIVNPANSVERLSIQQLRAIYTGRIRSWNQVGGPDAPIELYGRNQKSGTGEMFAQMVVGKDAQGHALPTLVAPDHQIEDSSAIVDAVMQSPNAIGYVSSPLIRSAKALAISDGSNAALSPSELAIVTEDYPIGRRLYLYAPGDASDLAQAFIRYAVNSRGQAVVTEAHYVALTPKSFAIHDVPPDAPAEYAEIAQHYQRLGLSFRFASGQAGISSGGHDSLDNLARDNVARLESYLAQHNSSGDDILLIGYADNVGGAGPNKALALSRAESVAESLATDDVRVPNSAIRSFGMELPVASNDTPEGRARNRRVEVWVRKGVE